MMLKFENDVDLYDDDDDDNEQEDDNGDIA